MNSNKVRYLLILNLVLIDSTFCEIIGDKRLVKEPIAGLRSYFTIKAPNDATAISLLEANVRIEQKSNV